MSLALDDARCRFHSLGTVLTDLVKEESGDDDLFLDFGVMLAISLLAIVVDPAFAQTKEVRLEVGKVQVTQTHLIEVGDVPNHQRRLFELHTVWRRGPGI